MSVAAELAEGAAKLLAPSHMDEQACNSWCSGPFAGQPTLAMEDSIAWRASEASISERECISGRGCLCICIAWFLFNDFYCASYALIGWNNLYKHCNVTVAISIC